MNKLMLIWLLLPGIFVSAQSKPSQKSASQAQMERELKEMEKENPEMAKQIRKAMQQQGGNKSTDPIVKNPAKGPSTSASNFILPVKIAAIKIPTEAESKDHIFWFRGKKANDSTLITTKGMVVQYKKKTGQLIIQPDSKADPFSKMIAEFKKTDQRKNEFIDRMMKTRNGHLSYPWVKEGLDAIDQVQNEFGNILKNQLPVPVFSAENETEHKMGKGGYLYETAVPDWLVRDHASVQAFVTSHTRDTWFYIPPPPIQSFDYCETCDTIKTKDFIQKKSEYIREFSKNEAEAINKALKIISYVFQNEKMAELQPYKQDMETAISQLFDYLTRKVGALVKQYGKDFNRMSAIVNVIAAVERQKQLYGTGSENMSEMMDYIQEMTSQLEPYVDRLILEKDYSQLMDITWIIGMERQKQLLGTSEEDDEFFRLIAKVTNFNRFKLTMEMKSKMVRARDENGNIVMTADADLKGEDYFSLIPIKNCKLKLISNKRSTFKGDGMSPEEVHNAVAFPMVLMSAHATDGSFIGPSQWVTISPVLNPSFCSSPDTMIIAPVAPRTPYTRLIAMNPVEEKWNLKDEGVTSSNIVSQLISDGFPDHESGEIEEMDESAIIEQLMGGLDKPNDKLNMLEYKYRVLSFEAQMVKPETMGMIFVIGEIHNKTGLVFNEKLNGKENNEHAEDIIESSVLVRLEHEAWTEDRP